MTLGLYLAIDMPSREALFRPTESYANRVGLVINQSESMAFERYGTRSAAMKSARRRDARNNGEEFADPPGKLYLPEN
jgi:hypothetical protein